MKNYPLNVEAPKSYSYVTVSYTHLYFNPVVMTCPTLLKMASQGGANALGLGASIGSVEEGKKADVILLKTEQPHIRPTQNLVNSLVEMCIRDRYMVVW